jgi:hypothetical protein
VTDAVCVSGVCVPAASPVEAGAPDGAVTDPIWGCLGRVIQPRDDRTGPIDVEFNISDANHSALGNVSAKLCMAVDIGCAGPIGTYVADAQGKLGFSVPAHFRGYLEMDPSAAQPELLPTLYYLPPVIDGSSGAPPQFFATIVTKLQLDLLTQQFGKPADPALGHLLYVVQDCRLVPAADVSVHADGLTPDSGSYEVYFDSIGTPSLTQQQTSVAGVGAFLNLPPGTVTLNYDHEGQRVGSQNFIVRKGGTSYVVLDPTP